MYRAMTSKDETSPCSIWETRATLTPIAAAISFLPQPELLASLGELVPPRAGKHLACPGLDFLGRDPGDVQFVFQVFPVNRRALGHLGYSSSVTYSRYSLSATGILSRYHRCQPGAPTAGLEAVTDPGSATLCRYLASTRCRVALRDSVGVEFSGFPAVLRP
jgi:hypothetical protein